ncbi:MAG: phosphoribosylglycinamide formyltransferase [Candidatus Bilamarchaeum sp.]|jgi:phosphoribosylglycinamide formyltransferase-1
MDKKLNLAILASGRGSNFKAILEAITAGTCNAKVNVLITNNPQAPAIEIAREYGVRVEVVSRNDFQKREDLDAKIKSILDQNKTDLVALCGYMLLLKDKELLKDYKNKIINIHPSLLPSFPGSDAQEQAFDYGSKISGFTIHFVDQTLDGGAIIHQKAVDISNCKSAQEVCDLILKAEHQGYSKVIDMFSKGKFVVEGRTVRYISN